MVYFVLFLGIEKGLKYKCICSLCKNSRKAPISLQIHFFGQILSLKGHETIYDTFSSYADHFAILLNGKHMVVSSLSECVCVYRI